jgi:hypothetical protein
LDLEDRYRARIGVECAHWIVARRRANPTVTFGLLSATVPRVQSDCSGHGECPPVAGAYSAKRMAWRRLSVIGVD